MNTTHGSLRYSHLIQRLVAQIFLPEDQDQVWGVALHCCLGKTGRSKPLFEFVLTDTTLLPEKRREAESLMVVVYKEAQRAFPWHLALPGYPYHFDAVLFVSSNRVLLLYIIGETLYAHAKHLTPRIPEAQDESSEEEGEALDEDPSEDHLEFEEQDGDQVAAGQSILDPQLPADASALKTKLCSSNTPCSNTATTWGVPAGMRQQNELTAKHFPDREAVDAVLGGMQRQRAVSPQHDHRSSEELQGMQGYLTA